MNDQPVLKGQVALITGASRGIGKAIALHLASLGADICINYHSNVAQAETTVAELKALNCNAVAIAADVSNGEAVEQLFRQLSSTLGPATILVNNAGITRDSLLLRMSEDDWDTVLDTNLKSAYLCSKAALRAMIKARSGRIINIASVVALTGNPGQANYTAAKGGLISFTRTLAREVAGRSITVNVVAPGFIETDMTAFISAEARAVLAERIPLGYIGSPQDIAAAVGFLCTPAARYITGHTLSIDGGLSL